MKKNRFDWLIRGRLEKIRILGNFVTMVALVILIGALAPTFSTKANLLVVLDEMSILLLISTGLTLVILTGAFDLSIASTVALTGSVSGVLFHMMGLWAILPALFIGLCAGLLNGLLVTKGRVSSFVGTMGTLIVYQGLAEFISKGQLIYMPESFRAIAMGKLIFGLPNIFVWSASIFALILFLSFTTPFGRRLYAIGLNTDAAILSGINVPRHLLYVFIISGFLSGFGGILAASITGYSSASLSFNLLLPAIAAVGMGGTLITGGIGGVHRTFLGVLTLTLLSNGMQHVGVSYFIQQAIHGIVLILAVGLSIDRSKLRYVK